MDYPPPRRLHLLNSGWPGLAGLTLGCDLGDLRWLLLLGWGRLHIRGPVVPVSPLLGPAGPWGLARQVTGQLSERAYSVKSRPGQLGA